MPWIIRTKNKASGTGRNSRRCCLLQSRLAHLPGWGALYLFGHCSIAAQVRDRKEHWTGSQKVKGPLLTLPLTLGFDVSLPFL